MIDHQPRQHPVFRVLTPLAVQCRPPLHLSDGRDLLGLTQDQCDDVAYLVRRYYLSIVGALDPLPSGVGHGTNHDKLGHKRHKPESKPPPKAADLDEPDWVAVRLADAIELRCSIVQQEMLRWRIHDKRTVEWCAESLGHDKDWVELRWGRLVTWLYARSHGLVE